MYAGERGSGRGTQDFHNGLGEGERIKRPGDNRLGLRPIGKPTVLGTAGENDHGRAAVHLVFELFGDTHAARGRRLTIEDDQIDAALVHPGLHGGLSCHLDIGERGESGRGVVAQCLDDLPAGGSVAAVDQNPQHIKTIGTRRCLCHQADATRRSPSGAGS